MTPTRRSGSYCNLDSVLNPSHVATSSPTRCLYFYEKWNQFWEAQWRENICFKGHIYNAAWDVFTLRDYKAPYVKENRHLDTVFKCWIHSLYGHMLPYDPWSLHTVSTDAGTSTTCAAQSCSWVTGGVHLGLVAWQSQGSHTDRASDSPNCMFLVSVWGNRSTRRKLTYARGQHTDSRQIGPQNLFTGVNGPTSYTV